MLERLNLSNFRKFDRFSLRLEAGNILVGPNNSGKSSILDAFRLLEACYRYTKNHRSDLLNIPGEGYFETFQIPESVLPFRLANATHNYNSDDAIVEFWSTDKTRAVIRLHPNRSVRFYVDKNGSRLNSSAKFRSAFPVDIVTVPTLAPLEVEEEWVQDATVQRNASTRLASRVLRNIWLRRSQEEFVSFSCSIKEAWPSIELHKPEKSSALSKLVEMYYSEDRIDREVQWAGFGFQVWLQIQTHLRRGSSSSILVIDEPDIYLHPDLQRKLLKDIKARFCQFVMATHAVEIINEADTKDIVTINPAHKAAKRIKSEEDYTNLYRYLGSNSNTDISRIARAKQVIFVEGKDGKILRKLATQLGLDSIADLQGTPIIKLGGVAEWKKAIHAVWAFRHILDLEIKAFCIFDRDFRSDEEAHQFIQLMKSEQNFECEILKRKEIENYLLIPEALKGAINARLRARKSVQKLSDSDVSDILEEVTEGLKEEVATQRVSQTFKYGRENRSKLDLTTVMRKCNAELSAEWVSLQRRLEIVPGKEAISRLNDLLAERFHISLSEPVILEHMLRSTVPTDMVDLLTRLNSFCAQVIS